MTSYVPAASVPLCANSPACALPANPLAGQNSATSTTSQTSQGQRVHLSMLVVNARCFFISRSNLLANPLDFTSSVYLLQFSYSGASLCHFPGPGPLTPLWKTAGATTQAAGSVLPGLRPVPHLAALAVFPSRALPCESTTSLCNSHFQNTPTTLRCTE